MSDNYFDPKDYIGLCDIQFRHRVLRYEKELIATFPEARVRNALHEALRGSGQLLAEESQASGLRQRVLFAAYAKMSRSVKDAFASQ